MNETLVCWNCGAPLADWKPPFSRLEKCKACGHDLHVCRLCEHYNPRISDKCEEPRAEHPLSAERANFCDYFTPRPGAFTARRDSKAEAARGRLDSLFGQGPEQAQELPEADAARERLERLFGTEGKGEK